MKLSTLCRRSAYGGHRCIHQTLLVMRFTALLLTASFLNVAASGLSQEVSFSGKNIPLEKIFKEVKRQTGYQFMFSKDALDDTHPVTVEANRLALADFLRLVLKDQPVSFSINSRSIFFFHKAAVPEHTAPLDTIPKQLSLSGHIVDAGGRPLAGATITNTNTKISTSSRTDGSFSIPGYPHDKLLVSYIGFAPKDLRISSSYDGKGLVISLSLADNALKDVEINKGYYTTSKRLNTGDVSTVTAKDIATQPVTNVLAALDGRVPGLLITQTTGLPGGSFKVDIRGRTAIDRTITDDQPLFIIDGIPAAANNGALNTQFSALGDPSNFGGLSPFNSINPSDIESIEVLKDADATAIYGSRGANGVILITTKKGRAGKTKVDANVYSGFSNTTVKIPTLNTPDYIAKRRQAFANDGDIPNASSAYDFLVWDTTRYHDFNKLLGRKSSQTQDANLSVSGGNANTQFLVGAAYHHETTVLPGDLYDRRISAHFNLSHNSDDRRFKMSVSGSYSVDNNHLLNKDLANYYNLPPNLQLYDAAGNLAWNEGGVVLQGPLNNPLVYTKLSYTLTTNNLNADMLLSYTLTKGLTIKTNLGYNNIQSSEVNLTPKSAFAPTLGIQNSSDFTVNHFDSYIVEPQLEYSRKIGEGKLNALAGGSLQSTNATSLGILASGYPSESLMQSLVGATSQLGTRTSSPYVYEAGFGRLNYDFKERYLLNLTVRRDGSSRFGSDKRFANFGSVGAAWIFSDEPWMKNVSFLSFGKLRSSYGITGNDKISNYQYLDTWTTTQYLYDGSAGLHPTKLFNPDYHWERTAKLEGALELGFLNDRILLSTIYFNNSSSNALVQYKLPGVTGFTSVVANLPAKVVNSGWEFTLTTYNVKTKDFTWSTNFNITIPKNKLVSFPGLDNSPYKYTYALGHSLNVIYKYKYTGVDPQTGIYTFEDKNKDGLQDQNDYEVQGDLDPRFYGGLQNSIRYKSFTLDFLFTFRKQLGATYEASFWELPGDIYNLPTAMKDFWTHPGQLATHQRLSQDYAGAAYQPWYDYTYNSNAVYGDASFVRLKNVSLSYSLPSQLTQRAHINLLRIYVQGQNLLTFTGYKVGDPEIQSPTVTPPLRTIVLGAQLTF